MRYHVNNKGEARRCNATVNCPFGDLKNDHYSTEAEAREAYETRMRSEIFSNNSVISTVDLTGLKKLAKFTKDPKVLNEIIGRGTPSTIRSLLKNENVQYDYLSKAYQKFPELHLEIARHPNYPENEKTPEELFDKWSTSSDSFSPGAHVMKIKDISFTDDDYNYFVLNDAFDAARGMLLNNNTITNADNKVFEFAYQNPGFTSSSIREGKFPEDRIKELPEENIYWGDVYNTKNTKVISGYTDWVLKKSYSDKAEYLASTISSNPNTPDSDLYRLAKHGFGTVATYSNSNASEDTKKEVLKYSGAAQSLDQNLKIAKSHGLTLDELKKDVVETSQTNYPIRNRGYSVTNIKVSQEKMKKYGLDKRLVLALITNENYHTNVLKDDGEGYYTFRREYDSTD